MAGPHLVGDRSRSPTRSQHGSRAPLGAVQSVVYIDALWIKGREGKIAKRLVYLAVGVDLDGCEHVLGLWIRTDSEGARQWLTILGELKA
ncbi:transposase [Streptomyces sp. NPDC005775]|uniref:transposase n=1 Tax=Streptomyces sp. NPDC005775 TaxID=3364729 RepID=UPI003696A8E1